MNWKYSESFAGIGAWGKAVQRVTKRHGDTSELQWYAEIDKYASNAFAAIHEVNEDLNICDITQDIEVKPMDIFFYSPPCQTFSIAGKRELTSVPKGNLFYDAVKFIRQQKPKFAIMENVRGLPSGDSKQDFNNMLWYLEEIGYVNYWKILNTKNYGIPQNRERVFIVSIRKDLYDNGKRFEWPTKKKLELRLKDLLDVEVDEKYYLSNDIVNRFIQTSESDNILGTTAPSYRTIGQRDLVYNPNGVIGALTATDYKQPKQIMQVGNLVETDSFGGNPQVGRVYDPNGISPALNTMQGGGREPKIVITPDGLIQETLKIKSATVDGYEEASPGDSITLDRPESNTRRGRVGKEVSQTLTTSCNVGFYNGLSIRKLTPLECFRLQGFDDEDYYAAVEAYENTFGKGKSDSQMYKRAGNSITVNVIEEILENLLYNRKQNGQQLSLF